MRNLPKLSGLAAIVLLGALSLPTMAQNAGGGAADPNAGQNNNGGGGGNNGGGRQRFDPAQFRQQMMDRLKEQLGATDDEFKALQPKLEKVSQLQRDMNAGRFGGGRQRGGPGGGNNGGGNNGGGNNGGGNNGGGNAAGGNNGGAPGATQPQSAIATKTKELTDLLADKDAKPDAIKSKLDELRAEKAKAKDELTKAQADLRELLSQRQEAVLVTTGMLD